jgi:hypothetical protein
MKRMNTKYDGTHCPLCGSDEVSPFFEDKKRSYLRCRNCELVFVPKRYWPSVEDERSVYDLHQNDSQDPGYRRFLSRLSAPLLEKLGSLQKGLDFGCGPGPTLSVLLEEGGHQVDLYDPFYYNDPSVLLKKYDFICATEVAEHMHDPKSEFTRLFSMLNPGGVLGVMTKWIVDEQAFGQWHYIRDKTHVCFYSRSTFLYIAERFDADPDFVENDVVLLNRKY